MAWTQPPVPRVDIAFESYFPLDGSGDFTSDWIDTAGVEGIRVAAISVDGSDASFVIEEALYGGSTTSVPQLVRSQSVTITSGNGYAELDLSTRWFRFLISGGEATADWAVSIRGMRGQS